jgi:hypothetical protein
VLLQDLKLGQYVHLAPKCTFSMQIVGTIIGCAMAYITMEQITTEKRDVLLAIQGTNIWSGQVIQKENSAVSFRTWLRSDTNLTSAGNYVGRTGTTSIWSWWEVPIRLTGLLDRDCSTVSYLARPQIRPTTPSRLLEPGHHLWWNEPLIAWHPFRLPHALCCWVRVTVLAAPIPDKLVP